MQAHADSEGASLGCDEGCAVTPAISDGARCVCVCREHVPTHAALRQGRMRCKSTREEIVTTCESLRRWQQRCTFRSVARLRGGGTGNVCNTAPNTVAISATPKQESLW